MSIKFYSPDLEEKVRQYVAKANSTNIAVLNELIELLFDIPLVFDEDILENFREVHSFMKMVDWETMNSLQAQVTQKPLTRRATIKDVTLAMIDDGCLNYAAAQATLATSTGFPEAI